MFPLFPVCSENWFFFVPSDYILVLDSHKWSKRYQVITNMCTADSAWDNISTYRSIGQSEAKKVRKTWRIRGTAKARQFFELAFLLQVARFLCMWLTDLTTLLNLYDSVMDTCDIRSVLSLCMRTHMLVTIHLHTFATFCNHTDWMMWTGGVCSSEMGWAHVFFPAKGRWRRRPTHLLPQIGSSSSSCAGDGLSPGRSTGHGPMTSAPGNRIVFLFDAPKVSKSAFWRIMTVSSDEATLKVSWINTALMIPTAAKPITSLYPTLKMAKYSWDDSYISAPIACDRRACEQLYAELQKHSLRGCGPQSSNSCKCDMCDQMWPVHHQASTELLWLAKYT